ncbi:MAG: hypothetical protein ACLFSQ_03185 [Candidatus Zixiibacteriota bacterium]
MKTSLYDFVPAQIISIRQESKKTNTYSLRVEEPIDFAIGQFIIVNMPSIGQFPVMGHPISKSGDILEITLSKDNELEKIFCIQKHISDTIMIRGGYGNALDISSMKDKNLLFIASNSGIINIKPIFYGLLQDRDNYQKIDINYSSCNYDELIYKEEHSHWQAIDDTQLTISLEKPKKDWSGYKGNILDLLLKNQLKLKNTIAFISVESRLSSSIMEYLLAQNFDKKNIFIVLLEDINCGVGKCSKCNIGPYLKCKDGPIMNYSDIERFLLSHKKMKNIESAYV